MGKFMRVAVLAFTFAMLLSGCDWFVSPEERVARAEKFLAAGDDRAAAIELQNALGSQPDDVRARLMLARISLRLGDLQATEKELERARGSNAPAEEVAVIAADVRLAKGEFADLSKQIESGELALGAAQAPTYQGLALLGLNEVDRAIDAFNAALAIDAASSRARLGLAQALAQQGRFDAALDEIGKITTADPSDAHAWSLKGGILARRGEFSAAIEALEAARKNAPGDLTAVEQLGLLSALVEARLASGDVKSARTTLGDLSQRAPNSPLAHLLAARIGMTEQKYAVAVTEAQKAIAAAPSLPQGKLLLGAALLANGDYNQAEAQLSALVQQAPDNIEARKLLAETNLRLQRPDVAMQVLAPTQETGASDPQVEALLGWANLQRGDEALAVDLLERSVAARPADSSLKLNLALAYISAGRYQDAVALLDALPAQPGDARRERLLISAITNDKGAQAAHAEVEKIIKANPKDVGVLNVGATFYMQQREFDQSRQVLQGALALEPKNVGTLSNLARLELLSGDDAGAQNALQELLEADSAQQSARIALAQLALRKGDAKGARDQLEEVRSADAKAIEPRLMLASLYLRERKTSQADEVLKELVVLARGNPRVAVATGRLYLGAGRYGEALNQFRVAVQREPRNPAWLLEVARVQVARGDSAGARDSIQQALELDPDSIAANAMMVGFDLKQGQRDQVLARVARVKKAHPDDGGAAILEGDVLLALNDAPAAARAFATSYKISPTNTAAIRAYRARSAARLPGTTGLLVDWLERQPRDLGARMILAQGLMEQGQSAQAIEQYETVAAAGQPNAMALNNLAWLYFQKGDARAEATAKKAYDLSPDVASIADTYGWILVERGRAAEGLSVLERAVGASGASPEVHYHHAVALARTGKHDQARTSLQRLLATPGFALTAQARKLLVELGDGG